jgi:hypothetical protein
VCVCVWGGGLQCEAYLVLFFGFKLPVELLLDSREALLLVPRGVLPVLLPIFRVFVEREPPGTSFAFLSLQRR